jgi:hypothetical protein
MESLKITLKEALDFNTSQNKDVSFCGKVQGISGGEIPN